MTANKAGKYIKYLFLGFLLILFIPIIPAWLKDIITNENNQHCIVIPFISLYIAFTKKGVVFGLREKFPAARGNISVFVLGLVIYFIGTAGDIIFFRQSSLIVLLAGAVLYVYGTEVFKELAFPIAYLIFSIPIPEAVYQAFSSPMKLFASKSAEHLIRFMSIPVYREGVNLFFPYASVEVVDACSGMRSLISLIAVAAAFSYFFQKTPIKRAILIISAVPVAVVSNITRIVITGLIAHLAGSEYAKGFLHTLLGTLVVLVIGTSALLLVNFLLSYARKGPVKNVSS